jgi:hypothetical protein
MSHVETAGSYARRLCEMEARRTGLTLKDAIRPVARRLKAAPTAIWSLLYEPPKSICADLFARIQDAVDDALEREIHELELELAKVRAGAARRSPVEMAEIDATLAKLRSLISSQGSLAL